MKPQLVTNWRKGWRWFSTWAFMLIVFLATTPLPPELTDMLPPIMQDKLTAVVAVCGLILRFVSQNKPIRDGHGREYRTQADDKDKTDETGGVP